MHPFFQFIFNKKTGLNIEDIKSVLDIGANNSPFANALHENGIAVTAIDTEDILGFSNSIDFKRTGFEDFETDTVFDLVFARNVVPFLKDRPKQVSRMLTMGKYVFFTFFGPHDPWAEKGLTITKDEILPVLKDVEIIYFSEEEYIGPTMSGTKKPWHVFTYLVKTSK